MSKFYCPRIKNGIAFTPNRDYDVCSVRNLNLSSKLGISSTSLKDFLNSDYRKKLIETADKEQWPSGCEGCLWLEKVGLPSSRLSEINIEKENGTSPIVHFNSGSICDSDCIMCGPRWSTSIANRLKEFPDPNQNYFTLGNDGVELPFDKAAIQNLKDAILVSKRLKILGGEPFLDKKLWNFLNTVANKDLELLILTNGNTFPSTKQLSIFKKFSKIQVIFSIDGTGITHEWLRQNLSFKKIATNYLKMQKIENVSCTVTSVVQAHNLLNLKDLIKLFKSNISFNLLLHPELLAVRNAPKWVIEQAIDETSDHEKIQTMLKLSLKAGPTHDIKLLQSHTEYLNSHRQHYFNFETWQVQKR